MMIVACVRTGDRYPMKWVERLRDGVRRHISIPHDFICLTDDPRSCQEADVFCVDIGRDLPGWWGKMALFDPVWRKDRKVVYLDIDCVPIGPLDQLASLGAPFSICDGFGKTFAPNWNCRYNSSVMVINEKFGGGVWKLWNAWKPGIMLRAGRYGDQKAIEELIPDAALIQNVLPGFFIHWKKLERDCVDRKPDVGSIVVFAGSRKPDNTPIEWIKKEWEQ